jgi:hypothetical protein
MANEGYWSKLTARFKGMRSEDAEEIKKNAPPSLRLLSFINDWDKVKLLQKVFEEEKVRFHFIMKGRGTAPSDILDILGIGASDKAVVLCLEQAMMVPVLIKEARRILSRKTPGAGIAFTVPLSGINTPIMRLFRESVKENEKLKDHLRELARKAHWGRRAGDHAGGNMEIKNDLIVAIINQGFSDEFMAAAKEAGASGGTVISARGLAREGSVKFFGVQVQEEREIILMLTAREKKAPIMQAVSAKYGLTSKAGGIIFALPADSVMSLASLN